MLIERIAAASKLEKEEIERRVEAKRAKLSGLVSKEGAAQIVAAELGINFDQERMKISEIVSGMKRVNVVGKIVQMNPVREYSKNGRSGKVGSFLLADESSNVRVVLWDTNHINLVESGKLCQGSTVEIFNASERNGELHLSSFGDIKVSKEVLGEVVSEKPISEKSLKDVKVGDSFKTRAFILQAYEPRYFEVCPICAKRVLDGECKEHGKVEGVKRAILTVVLDDGTETMRCVLFGEQIKQLGLSEDEIFSLESFALAKEKFIGEEKYFVGQVRSNQLYNAIEFVAQKVDSVLPEILVKELEGSVK